MSHRAIHTYAKLWLIRWLTRLKTKRNIRDRRDGIVLLSFLEFGPSEEDLPRRRSSGDSGHHYSRFSSDLEEVICSCVSHTTKYSFFFSLSFFGSTGHVLCARAINTWRWITTSLSLSYASVFVISHFEYLYKYQLTRNCLFRRHCHGSLRISSIWENVDVEKG